MSIILFRKKINFLYKKVFGLNKDSNFSLSDKTINCLVNKGSENANEAIQLVKKLKSKSKNKIKLENIILENIE